MEQSLNKSAGCGDVEALYSILSADPHVLDRFDQISFVDNPLHIAAAAGNTHFAMEIATLKPSLAWKLNHLGFSPMHLALQNGHDQLVRAMLTIDSEFVRVKAKGRVTPLHYVAQIEDVDLLVDFLSVCPSSIEDLTVQCENAAHLAVKNYRFRAFEVLLGWLKRTNKEEILKWKDEDGNTVLHIATDTNQPKVMKSVIPYINVNAKNLSGLTAEDIFNFKRDSLGREVGKILRRAKAKRASELKDSSITLADYLSRDLSLMEKRDKRLGIVGKSQENSADLRNIILVVAILIATATYQAVLSPPGGYWQETSPLVTGENTNTFITSNSTHFQAGKMILGSDTYLILFYIFNSLAFYASLCTILTVISGLPYFTVLFISTSFLIYAYHFSLAGTFPSVRISRYISIMYALAVTAAAIPQMAVANHEKLKSRVDYDKRRLG
ncbi:Ankyrin repeat family protein [Melia azedarach]|uniref:Ankyrin repeat family protein n=1 Tax=Melia azedarach TaxID=155640 RepID=A0ACC1XMT5_MELAZ|nr:Ankyrin repeat family protein [Melia azedarach]